MALTPTRESEIETITRLEPLIREHADTAERDRRLAMPVVEAIRDAGLFRMTVPKSLGGAGRDPMAFYEAVEAIAKVDGSVGWCFFISTGAAVVGRYMSDAVAEEVFGDPRTIGAGAIFPPGSALPVDGGYSLSGHWTFASGCQHANWLIGMSGVMHGGKPRMNPMGMPETRIALLPQHEAMILDTWDVAGLAATGSHDFELHDHFIPEARMLTPVPQTSINRYYDGPAHTLFPFVANFGLPMAMVALGIAQGAIDHCRELATTKVPRGSEVPLRERPLFQYRLADAVATAASARSWLMEELRRTWEVAQAGQPVDTQQRNRLALAAAHGTRSGATATDLMYTAGGGTALYRKSPLQRALRDVHAVTQHIATSPQSIENAGRVLVGFPFAIPLLSL